MAKRGRPHRGPLTPDEIATRREQSRLRMARMRRRRGQSAGIAVMDLETDQFGADVDRIEPFVGEIFFGDERDPIVIWDDDPLDFKLKFYDAIANLDERWIIYAHNGGRFDWMFFLEQLRGRVSFKGGGLMSAKIGNCEIRDSYHILPVPLSSINKDQFDYSLLDRSIRHDHRAEILKYLHNDCRYLYEAVAGFKELHGLPLSIGGASYRKACEVVPVKSLGAATDGYIRQYFAGGRVECIRGAGHFVGDYRLYDVNSMYPHVMSSYQHPIGTDFIQTTTPRDDTDFLKIECVNHGALLHYDPEKRGGVDANVDRGVFYTTRFEHDAAMELGLIEDVKYLSCISFMDKSDFSGFVDPLYDERQRYKSILASDPDNSEARRHSLYIKLFLNNVYGKLAQDPSKFYDWEICEYGEHPAGTAHIGFVLDENARRWYHVESVESKTGGYSIWRSPAPVERYNNVATAASITGAARAVLMRAIYSAVDPIYCDTDSIICRDLPMAVESEALGAWTRECDIAEIITLGKKLYCYKSSNGQVFARSKGVKDLTWQNYVDMLHGKHIVNKSFAPTFTRANEQLYITREIKSTVAAGYISRMLKKRGQNLGRG